MSTPHHKGKLWNAEEAVCMIRDWTSETPLVCFQSTSNSHITQRSIWQLKRQVTQVIMLNVWVSCSLVSLSLVLSQTRWGQRQMRIQNSRRCCIVFCLRPSLWRAVSHQVCIWLGHVRCFKGPWFSGRPNEQGLWPHKHVEKELEDTKLFLHQFGQFWCLHKPGACSCFPMSSVNNTARDKCSESQKHKRTRPYQLCTPIWLACRNKKQCARQVPVIASAMFQEARKGKHTPWDRTGQDGKGHMWGVPGWDVTRDQQKRTWRAHNAWVFSTNPFVRAVLLSTTFFDPKI